MPQPHQTGFVREHWAGFASSLLVSFSNLKTWLKGTHHGVGQKHLPSYVDEFVFRFSRRHTPMASSPSSG
jgi:hypothetical protein